MGNSKYTFQLSNEFLTNDERVIFNDFLIHHNLDKSIWDVFESLFKSGIKGTTPLLLRVSSDKKLCAAAIIIKCNKYGRSLFNNNFFARTIDFFGVPFYLWIKFGCCMDMLSNPGFVRDPEKSDEIYKEMANFLKKNSILTIINDYSDKSYLYPNASKLPALPHALIDTSKMNEIHDYIKEHKNIKRKTNNFKNKGGSFDIVSNKLSHDQLDSLRKCFISTAESSVFYLPYQDLYLSSAQKTSGTELKNVYYFIASMKGEFLGYQAVIKTGTNLNALHGAFDRTRKTNYHAYDLLFMHMSNFALDNGLKLVDFGAVINTTKQRMVNQTFDLSYFLMSKYPLIQWLFNNLLKITKIQGKEQMKYRNLTKIN